MAKKKKNETTEKGFELAAANFSMYANKNEVPQSYHALMDALTEGPLGFALTEHPTIYVEVIEEMWISAKYPEEKNSITVTIKGTSLIITPTVVNKALRLPTSNFSPVASDKDLKDMLELIKYDESSLPPGPHRYITRKGLRKEWSFYFDALIKAFSAKQGSFDQINALIMRIAHSLIYNKKINVGELLVKEICDRLGPQSERKKVIYYARFLMIIANYLVGDLEELLVDVDTIAEKHVQTKIIFSHLDRINPHDEVELVLPQHYQVYVSKRHRPQRQIALRSATMKEVAQPSKSKPTKKPSKSISPKIVGQKRKLPTTLGTEKDSESEIIVLESEEEEKLSDNMVLYDQVEVRQDDIVLNNQERMSKALHETEPGASLNDEVEILSSEFGVDHTEVSGPSTSARATNSGQISSDEQLQAIYASKVIPTETNRVLHPEIVNTISDANVEIAHGYMYRDDTPATTKAGLQREQEAADQEDGNFDTCLNEDYITDLDETLRLVRTEYLTSMGSASTNLAPQPLFEDSDKKYKSSLKLHVINGLQDVMSKLKGECENMRVQSKTRLNNTLNTSTIGSINLRLAKESTRVTTVQELENKVSCLETANAQILKNQQVMFDLLKAQSKLTTFCPAVDDVRKQEKGEGAAS